jgi:hypothetical protein
MSPPNRIASDTFAHAAEWFALDPGAEGVLRSDRVTLAVAGAIEALTAGGAINVDSLAAAIGGPRLIAEALAAYIEWRAAPPPAGRLQ